MEYIGKTKKEGRDITVYSGHLGGNNKKKLIKLLLVLFIIVGTAAFTFLPYQIGSVLGYWISQFVSGFKSHF